MWVCAHKNGLHIDSRKGHVRFSRNKFTVEINDFGFNDPTVDFYYILQIAFEDVVASFNQTEIDCLKKWVFLLMIPH